MSNNQSPTTPDRRSNGDLLSPTAVRTSMQQTTRPHLSTTMSNTGTSRQSMDTPATSTATAITPSSVPTQGATIEQSVRLFKVFDALRNGDTAAIARACRPDGDSKLEGTTVLHLAIQCAEQPVIEYVLSQQSADVNARDKEGNTPLHTAAMLGRAPIVKLLLAQEGINDALVNYVGKTPLDVARTPEIFQQLQLTRSMFMDTNVRKIHQLVKGQHYGAMEQMLADSRVRTTLDINGPELATDPATTENGGTLLHEAARNKDVKLAQLLLLNGADPFKRDRKGKLPQDVTKDERTRAILKRSPAAQAAQRSIQEKTILGEGAQVGGNMAAEAGPGGKESREMRGYLRKWTNYTSGYKLRWFVLEDGVLSYYKHQDDAGSACRGAINMRIAKLHMDPKDKMQFAIHGKSSVKYDLKANHEIEAKRWYWALNNAIQWTKDEAKEEQRRQQQESANLRDARSEQMERVKTREADVAQSSKGMLIPGASVDLASSAASTLLGSSMGDLTTMQDDLSIRPLSRTTTVVIDGDQDDDDEYGDDASSHEIQPSAKDAFSITAQSAKLQLDLMEQVAAALKTETASNPDMTVSHPTIKQVAATYDTAVVNLKSLLMDLLRISRDHEAYWQYRLEREQNIRRLWEDSMARVAQEHEELETRIGESEDKRKRTKRALKEALEGNVAEASPEPLEGGAGPRLELPRESLATNRSRRPTIAELTNNEVSDDDSEVEEEFFDAVDAGEVEVMDTMPPTSPPNYTAGEKDIERDEKTHSEEDAKALEIRKSYKGYEDGIRKRLKLDADNRPKVSLWGILKSMIGKDMTKMTLPVSFNEPTSLLYRVVEDMEYTDLLNVAAERTDSTERLVYVAGFAASEYASTIGRVAKPFNPLLGETYEYVRPDLGYRFFIEQVTHHPPVGAAYAESAKWDYYGESAVKSKFYGKSFEFNPLGTWFLHLRPASGGEELYTWKKVTSSVVGIITGNPVVDNYGLMEVKNWTTGEVCYLDFKAKGWKASSAYQVSGRVVDKTGRTRWSIGGRWNDKIYARYTPGYEASVEPPTGEKPGKDQAFLIWEAHPRPTGIPFNLTPFAVTLNDIPDRLRPFLAPTDTRLRPDQRAMELGEYDFAAVEKNRVEESQRARRRMREAKGEEFVPKWFQKAKHPVTGEEYWDFRHEYWKVREDVAEGKTSWEQQGLEDIY
ncbi:hypothetical protein LTR56_024610 [Elasticomyces elasticus]|nr:hypothetical protein LTR56_024610 [Elasticomyces elasticus]KAK3628254.1 hypothetical protein LTR22_022420 [Elasticomyces elasticus]KAK4908074.1 hypothetical protein LTR49_022972 [Elasticomyces elasticus]KAK5756277.1 hypothetical protein LTS12_013583 [Elasticomyces elasticus]